MKVEVTKAQLQAIIEMADDANAMVGGGDTGPDDHWRRRLKKIDAMLKKNGFKRNFK